jgi:hypothetical protein
MHCDCVNHNPVQPVLLECCWRSNALLFSNTALALHNPRDATCAVRDMGRDRIDGIAESTEGWGKFLAPDVGDRRRALQKKVSD